MKIDQPILRRETFISTTKIYLMFIIVIIIYVYIYNICLYLVSSREGHSTTSLGSWLQCSLYYLHSSFWGTVFSYLFILGDWETQFFSISYFWCHFYRYGGQVYMLLVCTACELFIQVWFIIHLLDSKDLWSMSEHIPEVKLNISLKLSDFQ